MTEYYVEKFYDEYALKKENTIIAVLDSGTNARKVCDLLNEQDERIKELEQVLDNFKPIIFKNEGEDLILYSDGDVE